MRVTYEAMDLLMYSKNKVQVVIRFNPAYKKWVVGETLKGQDIYSNT